MKTLNYILLIIAFCVLGYAGYRQLVVFKEPCVPFEVYSFDEPDGIHAGFSLGWSKDTLPGDEKFTNQEIYFCPKTLNNKEMITHINKARWVGISFIE